MQRRTRQSQFWRKGTRYILAARHCNGSPDERHLFVVGDSHATAYRRLIGNMVRQTGLSATICASAGCAMVSILEEVPSHCEVFIDESVAAVGLAAKSGDIVFLPGLRTQRYREYWEPAIRRYQEYPLFSDQAVRLAAERLRAFTDRGVRVVFEAPKPVYHYAPMRCMDWFNSANPHCGVPSTPAAEQQRRRFNALNALERLQQADPQIELWDPFLLLCPGGSAMPSTTASLWSPTATISRVTPTIT